MAKCPRVPDSTGYRVQRGAEFQSVKLDGGAPRTRRTQIGAWATVPVQFTCSGLEYDAMVSFLNGGPATGDPFTIDLITDSRTLTTHTAKIQPETLQLPASQQGETYVITATLDVDPRPL